MPSGRSSVARLLVKCPTALLLKQYGKLYPPVEISFVHPFMLLVITICGTNFFAPGLAFHFSSRGRKAAESQKGPTALVRSVLSKSSGVTDQ